MKTGEGRLDITHLVEEITESGLHVVAGLTQKLIGVSHFGQATTTELGCEG